MECTAFWIFLLFKHVSMENECNANTTGNGVNICDISTSKKMETGLFYISANVLPGKSAFKCRCSIYTLEANVEIQILYDAKQNFSESIFQFNSICVKRSMQIKVAGELRVSYWSSGRTASNITLCVRVRHQMDIDCFTGKESPVTPLTCDPITTSTTEHPNQNTTTQSNTKFTENFKIFTNTTRNMKTEHIRDLSTKAPDLSRADNTDVAVDKNIYTLSVSVAGALVSLVTVLVVIVVILTIVVLLCKRRTNKHTIKDSGTKRVSNHLYERIVHDNFPRNVA